MPRRPDPADVPLERLLAELLELPQPTRPVRSDAVGRYARTAVEYRLLRANGVADPGAWIARAHGVEKPVTARAWIMRAREAGLIGDDTEGEGFAT